MVLFCDNFAIGMVLVYAPISVKPEGGGGSGIGWGF